MNQSLRLLLSTCLIWASAAPAFAAGPVESKTATNVPAASMAAGLTVAAPLGVPSLPSSAVTPELSAPTLGPGAQGVGAVSSESEPSFAVPAPAAPGAVSLDGGTVLGPVSAAAADEAASARPRTLLGRARSALAGDLSWSQVFDASAAGRSVVSGPMSLRHGGLSAPKLPGNIVLGNAPEAPRPEKVGGIQLNDFDWGDQTPAPRGAGSVFEAGPVILQADPASEKDVERALRAMVDADSSRWGVGSKELKTVHVKRVPGSGDQADTIYAYFNQVKDSRNADGTIQPIVIQGSYLSFTVKVIKGQPALMSAMAGLYPGIQVDTQARASDDQLKRRALQVLNVPQNAGVDFVFSQRTIIYHNGQWKAVNLYDIVGTAKPVGVKVAVDIATGEVFAWDARHGIATATRRPAAPAKTDVWISAMAEAHEHRDQGKPKLSGLPLPRLDVSVSGKKYTADVEGKVTLDLSRDESLQATLSGTWAQINDQAGKPVKINTTVKPANGGNHIIATAANPDDLFTINQANMYIWITRIHDWWSSRLHGDSRIDQQIPVNVNIDDECNAYYTPGTPSLNFFRESANCSDTGRPGVGAHEYGHFVDDMIGGIVDGGLSEGWGDIGSMFLLGSPIIGDGFLKNQTPNYIRHGENTYQYSSSDEVHDQGQAWMGFAWKLRKALIAKLGTEAAGAAEAESLIVPTLFTKAHDIPSQMAQVLLNAMDKDGKIRHEKEIRAAAKAHGIDLPANPKGFPLVQPDAGFTELMGRPEIGWERPSPVTRLLSTITLGYVEARPKLRIKGNWFQIEQLKDVLENWMQYRPESYRDLSLSLAGWDQQGSQVTALFDVGGSEASVLHFTQQALRFAGYKQPVEQPASKPVLGGIMSMRRAYDRVNGTVEWYDPIKGYGFINVEGEKSLFVQRSDVLAMGRSTLNAGEALSFTIDLSRGMRRAANLQPAPRS